MKTCVTWVAVFVFSAVRAEEVKLEGHACAIDAPGQLKPESYRLVLTSVEPCFRAAVDVETVLGLKGATTLDRFQKFFTEFCPHRSRVVACLAEVRGNLSLCRNTEVAVPLRILGELAGHLLVSDCAREKQRLAYLAHQVIMLRKRRDELLSMWRCLQKVNALLNLVTEADIDLASESYLLYKQAPQYKRCLEFNEDQAYKEALEQLLNETVKILKCQHPRDDKLVLCSSVNVSEVPIVDICRVKPLNDTNLYDHLADKVIGCCSPSFNLDLHAECKVSDANWLKQTYQRKCVYQEISGCLLEKAAFADACLPENEVRQFRLFLEAVEEIVRRSCVEDGAMIARVMHEVYRVVPEKGHAIRDCYRVVSEGRVSPEDDPSHQGLSDRNTRFYQELVTFKGCLVEKLRPSGNGVANDMEAMFDDVLKKVKCVNPEDGTIVLCETIRS